MAVLTGLAPVESFKCASTTPGLMETCPLIWNDFKRINYSTAYAEDMHHFSTFHNGYAGFIQQPTDYYFRPFTIALEDNIGPSIQTPSELSNICMGNQFYIDYIQKWALDIAKQHHREGNPYFGLFWSNSFSHGSASIPAVIDAKVKEHLHAMTEIDNNTLIVFLSDHGIRYGATRFTESGYFEERLPFLYIYLPPSFQERYPKFAENLRDNRNTLTSPYDLHLTLQHILSLVNETTALSTLKSCPKCQSLLTNIPDDRTCPDVGIDDEYWCTCTGDTPYELVEDDEAHEVVSFAMHVVQDNASKMTMCAKLHLQSIRFVRKTKINGTVQYLVQWDTYPGTGIFEALVKRTSQGHLIMNAEYSRLSWYENEAWCVDTAKHGWMVKKSCYCTYIHGSSISLVILVSSALLVVILSAILYVIFRNYRNKCKHRELINQL